MRLPSCPMKMRGGTLLYCCGLSFGSQKIAKVPKRWCFSRGTSPFIQIYWWSWKLFLKRGNFLNHGAVRVRLEQESRGFWSLKTWKGATYANRKVLWHRDLHGVLWLFVQTFRGTDFGLILLGEDGAHQPMYEEKWAFLLFLAPKSFATRNWFWNFPFGSLVY